MRQPYTRKPKKHGVSRSTGVCAFCASRNASSAATTPSAPSPSAACAFVTCFFTEVVRVRRERRGGGGGSASGSLHIDLSDA